MSDNKNTLQNITISSDGISSARFTPEGMKKAMEQLIHEHQEFAEQARSSKEQLEVKEARIFELEGRLEAKERLLEEWGVDREKMVNKISELEMNIAGLKRDLDDWRDDAPEPAEPEGEKRGYQDFYDRIGATDLLHRSTAEPSNDSPKRRGESVKPEDLRVGDVVDIYGSYGRLDSEGSTVSHVEPGQVRLQGDSGAFTPDFWGTCEFRLVRRVEPELPTEPKSVILVTEWKGEKLDQPIHAVRGHYMWHSIPGDLFPGGIRFADTFSITGWKNARIVVEDGE